MACRSFGLPVNSFKVTACDFFPPKFWEDDFGRVKCKGFFRANCTSSKNVSRGRLQNLTLGALGIFDRKSGFGSYPPGGALAKVPHRFVTLMNCQKLPYYVAQNEEKAHF